LLPDPIYEFLIATAPSEVLNIYDTFEIFAATNGVSGEYPKTPFLVSGVSNIIETRNDLKILPNLLEILKRHLFFHPQPFLNAGLRVLFAGSPFSVAEAEPAQILPKSPSSSLFLSPLNALVFTIQNDENGE
jgi:hypothetical protein